MVPVEAQACGTPGRGAGAGGACETVIDGETGDPGSRGDDARGVRARRFDASRRTHRSTDERFRAERRPRFSRERFLARFPSRDRRRSPSAVVLGGASCRRASGKSHREARVKQ